MRILWWGLGQFQFRINKELILLLILDEPGRLNRSNDSGSSQEGSTSLPVAALTKEQLQQAIMHLMKVHSQFYLQPSLIEIKLIDFLFPISKQICMIEVTLLKRRAIVVMIVWQLNLQLPVQSVPITTKVLSLNPAHGEVYNIM